MAVSDGIIMEGISQEVILGREVETQSKETSQVVVIWRVFFFFPESPGSKYKDPKAHMSLTCLRSSKGANLSGSKSAKGEG